MNSESQFRDGFCSHPKDLRSSNSAWGEPIPTSTGTSSVGTLGYGAQSGYLRDGETGFYLCTYRLYDPSSGHWLTRDPIGFRGGSNLYGYVDNDPVNFSDPHSLLKVGPSDYPWLDFNAQDSWESAGAGSLATLDTWNPLGDPLADGGYYNPNSPGVGDRLLSTNNAARFAGVATVAVGGLIACEAVGVSGAAEVAGSNVAWKGFMRGGEFTLTKQGASKPFLRGNPWWNPFRNPKLFLIIVPQSTVLPGRVRA